MIKKIKFSKKKSYLTQLNNKKKTQVGLNLEDLKKILSKKLLNQNKRKYVLKNKFKKKKIQKSNKSHKK